MHTYQYDPEERIKSVDTTGATYLYGADGQRARKLIGSNYTEYLGFGGKPIAERSQAGDWTDYIFAGDRRLVRATSYVDFIQIWGTNCSNCGTQYSLYSFPSAGGLSGYVIRSGDKLLFLQYQVNSSRGGMQVAFSDGTNTNWSTYDQDGQQLNNDGWQNTWHNRRADLSAYAGKSISAVYLDCESTTPAGSWQLNFNDIALVSTDGTVRPIYNEETTVSLSMSGSSGVTGRSYQAMHTPNFGQYPDVTTTYYHGDHLGSARMMSSPAGFPIWQGTYYPFGAEIDPQITVNNYKFTGKERDSESGNDYFGARYYASKMGRWMSPDPALESEILELPQTWNRYSYVYNRPTFATDPDGRCPPCVGAIVGGVVEGGWNLGSQLFHNGGQVSDVNWREVGANTLGGAVAGALAGATGGGSLLVDAAIGAGSNIAGGVVTRIAEGQDANEAFDTGEVVSDAVSGFVGGGVGHLASDFVHPPEGELGPRPRGRRHAAKYDAEVNRRKNAALRALGVSTAAGSPPTHAAQWAWNSLTQWFEELFFSQASQSQPLREQVTHKICYTDEKDKKICQ